MMLHGILIKDGMLAEIDLKDDLEVFYKELNCDTIDIVRRKIGNRIYDIVCDEEGLFHDGYISMMDVKSQSPMLVGRLFICRHDGPELASLTEDDVRHVKAYWKHHVIWGQF